MNRPAVPLWIYASIAVTALLSAYSVMIRHQVESKNRAVTLAVEFETIEALAASQSTPIDKALADLKAQGMSAVVLGEESIGELVSEGYAAVSGNEIILREDRTISSTKAIEALQDRVEHGIRIRFENAKVVKGQDAGERAIRVEYASPSLIRQTDIGLNPSVAQAVKGAGLGIIARMSNPSGVTGAYVRNTIKWANSLGATIFLPQGDQVLGRRDALDETLSSLRTANMLYASPEFTKIGGDANIVSADPHIVVRLHSAQSAELDKMPLEDAIDRYSKAARERNMRVLLIRPISSASPAPLHDFGVFLKSINDQIRKEGGDMGPARPFEDPALPPFLGTLIALSVVPTAYFVVLNLFRAKNLAIGIAAIYLLLAIASMTGSGRSFAALGAAIVFPTAAFIVLDLRSGKMILAEFLIVCVISLVGGLAVAGMLNGVPYFVKAQEFRGIKVAVFLPIIAVAWYFAHRYVDIRKALKNPITWGAAGLALLVLISLAFMNSRTGNDNPGVSDLELKLRSILDAILFVRPRTKSFLVGHPLLIVGIGLLLYARKHPDSRAGAWAALLLTGGAIGQTDIVNTLCHLHTPVGLSLVRNAVAVIPGALIGLGAWAVIHRMLLKGTKEA
jgi:hypothetical protein